MAEIEEKKQQITRTMFRFDVALTVMAFLFSYWARIQFGSESDVDLYSHLAMLPLILAMLLFLLSYFNAYEGPSRETMISYSWSIFRSVSLCVGIFISLLYLLKIEYVSRYVIVLFSVTEFFLLTGVRLFIVRQFKKSNERGENFLKVLIIGTGHRAQDLSRTLIDNSEWGIEIIGHLDPDSRRVGARVVGNPVLGTISDISEVLKQNVVDEVLVAITRNMMDDAEEIAMACEEEGIKLRMMADVYDLQVARWSLVEVGHLPLLTLEPVALDEGKLYLKRVLDLSLTLLSMPVLLPLMAVIAIAVKLESNGPAFFVQERVGLKKRLFPMLKFRSMAVGSEEMLEEIEHLNEAEGPIFKIKDDPRVTRVGKFIRKTSLDELPQLFNVIKGDMSLVGPRPMSIRDVDLFDKGIQRKRFSVKPGVTCLWQISGRSDLPFSKWLELDLKYIENWSLFLDIKILFKTIPVVLRGSGAV